MVEDDKKEPSMIDDVKNLRDKNTKVVESLKDAASAVNEFFEDGTSKVIGPAATEALDKSKELIGKYFKRDER